MTLDLTGWGSIAAHAAACNRQCFTLRAPVLRIVWETVGARFAGPLEVYWALPGQDDGDVPGWTVYPGRAHEYPSREDADADLQTARETVHRGCQRGRVDLQEVA